MDKPTARQRFEIRWSRLVEAPKGGLPGAVRSSVAFAEAALNDTGNAWVRRWLATCADVEAYVSVHGAVPRNRRSNPPDVARLVFWLRRQRVEWDRLSLYQRERLDLLAGWSPDPRGEAFAHQTLSYLRFVKKHDRAPRRRGPRVERILADWHYDAVTARRMGRLPDWKLRLLDEIATETARER